MGWFRLGTAKILWGILFFTHNLYAWNVFGNDDRVEVLSRKYPWRTIGYLSTFCTGTLVGRNLVLTAGHCVVDSKTGKQREDLTAFYPNTIANEYEAMGHIDSVYWASANPEKNRPSDWAIIRLKEPLGETFGWMGISDDSHDEVTLAGYSGDFREGKTAGVHRGCKIKQRGGGLVYHDCDNARGASGAPMFVMKGDRAFILALNVAEFRQGSDQSLYPEEYHLDVANVAVPSSAFLDKVRKMKGQ